MLWVMFVQILFLERNFYVKCNMNFILYFKKAILSINISENKGIKSFYYIWNQYCIGSSLITYNNTYTRFN